jgi:hypothetical protein
MIQTFKESDLDDPALNRQWRKQMDLRARTDAKYRAKIIARARKDVVFFFKALCWLEEPRKSRGSGGRVTTGSFPFIPWQHQLPLIYAIREKLGYEDIVVEKSRDEGVSWISLLMALHDWLFVKGAKIGLVTSTEDLADDPGNADSLMAKLDWELGMMPTWLVGKKVERAQGCRHGYVRNSTKHYLLNCRNGATINATAGGPDIFRGGRKLWILMDEMASKQWMKSNRDVDSMHATSKSTDSRLMISTPSGPIGAYHDVVHEDSSVVKLQIRWSDNPTKNRGLYRMEKGIPRAVDPINNPLPPEYNPPNAETLTLFEKLRKRGFNLEKNLRSPWKDRECLRPKETPQSEARELDLDYTGAMDRVFGDNFQEAVLATEQPPLLEGHFSVNDTLDKWTYDRQPGGPFLLWRELDVRGNPSPSRYLVGCDSAHGEGGAYSSNSALVVIDLLTGEQVGEFTSKNIGRGDFADFAIGVCKWFYNAHLVWEHGGPGTAFTKRVISREYHNYYTRKVGWKSTVGKETHEPGWVATEDTKRDSLDEMRLAIIGRELLVRSKAFRMECEQYVQKGNSEQHVAASDKTHADRVIAMMVAYQAMKIQPKPAKQENVTPWGDGAPPRDTLAYREWLDEQRHADDEERAYGWDDRSTADLRSSHRMTGAA